MAFEGFKNVGEGEKESAPEEPKKDRGKLRVGHHVGGGTPLEITTEQVKQIAEKMVENEEKTKEARLEGNLERVRQLEEDREKLAEKRDQILQQTVKSRETQLG